MQYRGFERIGIWPGKGGQSDRSLWPGWGRQSRTRLARVNPPLATKRVAWMTAFRVVRQMAVLFLDTPLKSQFHKPNRGWMPGRLMGVSPDTRRTRAVDNFQTPGGAFSLRRDSQCEPRLRSTGGRQLSRAWPTLGRGSATVGTPPCQGGAVSASLMQP